MEKDREYYEALELRIEKLERIIVRMGEALEKHIKLTIELAEKVDSK